MKTVEDFLDSIENQRLYQILIMVDRLTLQIVVMKIQGYSTREIASRLNTTEKAVYRRMDRLKEKIEKVFLSRGENRCFPRTMGCKAKKPSPYFPLCGENGDSSLTTE